MSDPQTTTDLINLVQALGLDAPAQDDHANRMHLGLEIALGAVPYLGLLIAIYGMGLVMFMLAPNRHRAAVGRLGKAPVASLLLGAAVWLPAAMGLALILTHFPKDQAHGQGLLAVFLFVFGSAGFSVCGRALAERVMPEASALSQTMLGLLALVMPLFSLVGLPVLLIAAPLGLGAWLTAGRSRPPTAP